MPRKPYLPRTLTRIALGICYVCTERDAQPGKTRCLTCIVRENRAARQRYWRRKGRPLCKDCSRTGALPNQLVCRKCADARANAKHRRYWTKRGVFPTG